MKYFIAILLCLTCGLSFGKGHNSILPPQTQVVVNQSVDQRTVSTELLRAIFTFDVTRWPNGQPVVVILQHGCTPATRMFTFEQLKMSPTRYKEIVDGKIQAGMIQKPIKADSNQDVLRIIQSTPGSIGYVDSFILVNDGSGIKQIKVTQ